MKKGKGKEKGEDREKKGEDRKEKGEHRKEKGEDKETRSEEREVKSIFGGIGACLINLKSLLTIDPTRQDGPAAAKADSITAKEEEANFMFELAYQGTSFNSIMEIMSAHHFVVDPVELEGVMEEAQLEITRQEQPEGKHGSKRFQAETGTK